MDQTFSNTEEQQANSQNIYQNEDRESAQLQKTFAESTNGDYSNLEEFLNESHMKSLLIKFESLHHDASPTRQTKHEEHFEDAVMSLSEFISALAEALGIPIADDPGKSLFKKSATEFFHNIDVNGDGWISWDDFGNYLISYISDHNFAIGAQGENVLIGKPKIHRISTIKATIAKIIFDRSASRYIAVSQDGIINTLSSELSMLRFVPMDKNYLGDDHSRKRLTKLWVTDCLCMANVNKLVVSTTNRDLHFYDLATTVFTHLFHLTALPSAAISMCYHFEAHAPDCESLLFLGTDSGDIVILKFVVPLKGLFETPFRNADSCWEIRFSDLPQQSQFVSVLTLQRVHSDWVKRVMYVPDGNFLWSCSSSAKDSLVFRNLDESKMKVYTFKLSKGVECFDYHKELSVIVTGSVDHLVRLWDPYVVSKPMAVLKGHAVPVVDVCIYSTTKLIFSYSKDGNFLSWDMRSYQCLQAVMIKDAVALDHGLFPLCVETHPANRILVAIENSIVEMRPPLPAAYRPVEETTHLRPVVAIAYCQVKRIVLSVCEGSDVMAWDLLTGKNLYRIARAHENDEISALAVDPDGEFLVTAARDGTARVWNLLHGQLEKTLTGCGDSEITGIVIVPRTNSIVLVGWGRRIFMYHGVKSKGSKLSPDPKWLHFNHHRDDILSASYYPPNMLATSSYDGEVFIWLLDRERMWGRLNREHALSGRQSRRELRSCVAQLSSPLKGKSPSRSSSATLWRPHSMGRSLKKSCHAVNQVLFLTKRAVEDAAILVLATGTYVEFWSLFGCGRLVASFAGTVRLDASLTVLTTDTHNLLLLTGDSFGLVTLHDIASYALISKLAEVANEVARRGSSAKAATISSKPPSIISSWIAHPNFAVSGAEVIDRAPEGDGRFLLTSSADCTVKLWTYDGVCLGMFGQSALWKSDLSLRKMCNSASATAFQGTRTSSAVSLDDGVLLRTASSHSDCSNAQFDDSPTLEERNGKDGSVTGRTSLALPKLQIQSPEPDRRPSRASLAADTRSSSASLVEDVERMRQTDVYKARSSIFKELERKKHEWSLLGDSYNTAFTHRMRIRQSRRANYNKVDETFVQGYGGLTGMCSPFKALLTTESVDFALPDGLPVTSKMVFKNDNAFQERITEGLTRESLPRIDPLQR